MKTDEQLEPAVFLQTVNGAVSDLKARLQYDYERAYPDLAEIIHIVLDEEETNAWELSLFPHLLLPDLVEAHVEKLNLQPADTAHDNVIAPHGFAKIHPPSQGYGAATNYQPALALCG